LCPRCESRNAVAKPPSPAPTMMKFLEFTGSIYSQIMGLGSIIYGIWY
jgi:hypothetical protein